MKKIIYLQKIGDLNPTTLIKLKKGLKRALKKYIVSVKILKDKIPFANFPYNPITKQYNGSYILDKLAYKVKNKNQFRTLGILNKDIYAGTYDFIFGKAYYPKNEFLKYHAVALISVARLKEKFYEREENKTLFELRILKEAIHELGHTFGLTHCKNNCIMQFSKSLTDTDKKPSEFCQNCSNELKEFFINLK